MLEANKSAWFEKVFAIYNRNLLKRHFHSLRISKLDLLKKNKPSVIYANHSSWWDGLIAFEISRLINVDSFIMMEEKHLRKAILFRRLGAFSVVRENPRQAVKSLNYAVNLLQEKPTRTLWIFPQGEILPNDTRPLKFYNGLSRIIKKTGGIATSLAIRYEFLDFYKPEIIIKVGAPEVFNSDNTLDLKLLTKRFEQHMTRTLDELKQDMTSKNMTCYDKLF